VRFLTLAHARLLRSSKNDSSYLARLSSSLAILFRPRIPTRTSGHRYDVRFLLTLRDLLVLLSAMTFNWLSSSRNVRYTPLNADSADTFSHLRYSTKDRGPGRPFHVAGLHPRPATNIVSSIVPSNRSCLLIVRLPVFLRRDAEP
jgi:hypothetical protein